MAHRDTTPAPDSELHVRAMAAMNGTRGMSEEDAFEVVRAAVIWAKSSIVSLAAAQIMMDSPLAEPPIYLDSLEFVAMITHLEEAMGLIAEDEHFSPRSMRSVRDVVVGVQSWIADRDSA